MVCITETVCVYWAVRTESLHKRACFIAKMLVTVSGSISRTLCGQNHKHTQRVCKLQTLDACSVIYHTQCSGLGFDSQERAGHFLFRTLHTPAVGHNRQRIPEGAVGVSSMAERPTSESYHSPPSTVKVQECVELHLHFPIRRHDVFH